MLHTNNFIVNPHHIMLNWVQKVIWSTLFVILFNKKFIIDKTSKKGLKNMYYFEEEISYFNILIVILTILKFLLGT